MRTRIWAFTIALAPALHADMIPSTGNPRNAMSDPPATTEISAPFLTVNVGDTFAVPISIALAANMELTVWQFDLSFDPTVVQANSVMEGPLLSSFGPTVFSPGVIDNVSGLISITAAFYAGLPPNPSGDGVLASIEFTALQPGLSPLMIPNAFLNFSDQDFTIASGQIQATPEPATLFLAASVIGMVCIQHFLRQARRAKAQAKEVNEK